MIDLNRTYHKFNKRYFYGLLPKDVRVEWSDDIRKGDLAACHVHGMTSCRHRWNPPKKCKGSYIRISRAFKRWDVIAEGALLHEMNHFRALREGRRFLQHGRVFNEGMFELAELKAFTNIW